MTQTRDAGPHRILFAHTSSLSSLFVSGQIDHFAAHGFEPHYAAAWDESSRPPDLEVPVWRLPLVRPPAPLRDAIALLAAVRLLRRLRPAVVHSGTPKAGLIVTAAAWVTRRPVRIYAVHGLRYQTATGWRRRLLRGIERCAAWFASDVVADSDSIRHLLQADLRIDRSKLHVLGPGSSNGVDMQRFHGGIDRAAARRQLGIDDDTLVIGFVGRLTRDKGLDDLVALHRTLSADLEVVLLVLGREEPDDPIETATRDHLRAGVDVKLISWTDRPEDAYRAMDLLVFPSFREGLPNVPLEAQASGIPVVGYRATGTIDAVPDPSALVPVGDRAALIDAVRTALDEPDELRREGERARHWVARFDSDAVWSARRTFVEQRLSEARRPGR